MEKICSECGINLTKTKYCKDCSKKVRKEKLKLYQNKYNKNNKEKVKEYYQRPEVRERIQKKFGEYNRNYSKRPEVREYQRNYMKKLRQTEEFKKKKRENCQKLYIENSSYRLRSRLSGRIRRAIKEQYGEKSISTMILIDCSLEFLKEYLQQTAINNGYLDFDINNYDSDVFHIDHIIPCASFDLSKEEEQKKCFHWSNMQILTANENYKKRDNIW
jgi:hypothetical protein